MELHSIGAELRRIYTFLNWPRDSVVSPLTLARHGFVCDGTRGARTRCVSCDLVVDYWRRGESPAEIHRERSPRCPFIRSTNTGYESTEVTSPKSRQKVLQSPGNDRSGDAAQSGETSPNWQRRDLQTSGLLQRQTQPTFTTRTDSGSAAATAPALCLVADSSGSNIGRQQAVPRSQVAVDSGTSFSSNVNRPTPSSETRQQVAYHQATTIHTSTTSAVSRQAGLPSEQPKHPKFSELSARIQSFSSGKVSPGQTAEGLATAGFYYVGPEDNVRCFWCNGGLKNFQPTDNPQTEHARWFPRCGFVQNNTMQFVTEFTGPARSTTNIAATSQTSVNVAAATNNANNLLSAEESESTLLEENKQLQEARTCKVCMDAQVDTVFLPCGHLVCCSNCSPSLRNCAICRALIRGTVKIFLSD